MDLQNIDWNDKSYMQTYWDSRFSNVDIIRKFDPAMCAIIAKEKFEKEKISNILIPGIGYGRNVNDFINEGFKVTGIEISENAIKLAKKSGFKFKVYHGSVLEMPFDNEIYDGIFCYNLLHLFNNENRKKVISRCWDQIKDKGLVFFGVISDLSPSFGKGKMLEINTFEIKLGKPVHFYTLTELKSDFSHFEILDIGEVEEPESTVTGTTFFQCRYIIGRKK